MPGFHISIWHALWMPKGTPKDIITKLNGAVVDALADAAFVSDSLIRPGRSASR